MISVQNGRIMVVPAPCLRGYYRTSSTELRKDIDKAVEALNAAIDAVSVTAPRECDYGPNELPMAMLEYASTIGSVIRDRDRLAETSETIRKSVDEITDK